MLNYNTPLTAEESAFAAEHHHLLLSYLKKARLDFDEFYDIAVLWLSARRTEVFGPPGTESIPVFNDRVSRHEL